jgi:hypothetical protein
VLALITATFPARERSRALAWYGVTVGVGFVSGQILGGGRRRRPPSLPPSTARCRAPGGPGR